ncbi:hypothetical protein [Pseudoflavitalea rhizosphaerae]|uniref:hypothetical protein n=1 Tax=Pseudoflavitalea rhizosphaerae TaxID=1884793 RepID=UPI000F8D11B2|nr:hypothetical protein [Pseudoflavitalea rhizosphaerae]
MGTHNSERKEISLPQKFENFRKEADKVLKKRKQNWTEEIGKIKRRKVPASDTRKSQLKTSTGRKKNGESFNKSTFARYYSALKRWNKLGEDDQELLTLFFNDLMEQGSREWKLIDNRDGTFRALQDSRSRYLHASHYLCYYWLHDNYAEKERHGISTSYFSFHYNDKQYPQFAWMEFYEELKKNPSFRYAPELSTTLVTNEPDISYFGQSMIVRMEGLDNTDIKAQFTFSMNQKMSMGKDLPKSIKGTYSTVAHMSATGEPMAGLLYLKQVESPDEAMAAISDPTHQVPDEVYHFLFGTKLVIGPSTKVQKTSYSIQQETNELKDYAGVYLGHILSKSKSEKPLLESIVVEVFSNTMAVIHVPDPDKPETKTRKYHGRIRLVKPFNNNLIGSFDISSEYRVSRFTMYIYRRLKEHSHLKEPQYYGVYAGVEYSSEELVAGRIRLTKKSRSPLREEEINSLVKAEPITETILKHDEDLVQLFSGMDPNFDFVDTLVTKHNMPAVNHARNQPFSYSGKYHIYELSHNQTHINRIPVEIFPDGNFVMQTGRSEKNQHTVLGTAHYKNEKFLALTGFDAESNFPVSHHLFSIQAYHKNELQHAFGVSTQVAPDNIPSAHIKILVPVSSGIKKVWSAFRIGSPEFKHEDESLRGLLTWLGGRYDRLFKAPGSPNKIYSTRMYQEDFVNIHFYAACYQAKQNNINNTVSHLYQAFLHGFNNIRLLETEAGENGSLYPLLNEGGIIRELQNESSPAFRKVEELVRAIRERHEQKNVLSQAAVKKRQKKK